MTQKVEDGLFTFNCDGREGACHSNFQADDPDDTFRETWSRAKDAGWVSSLEYVKGVSVWHHYCKKCKSEVGD